MVLFEYFVLVELYPALAAPFHETSVVQLEEGVEREVPHLFFVQRWVVAQIFCLGVVTEYRAVGNTPHQAVGVVIEGGDSRSNQFRVDRFET